MGCRGPWGWWEQQGLSGREPPTGALSGPVAGVICGFSAKSSHSPQPPSDHSRPRTKQPSQLAAPWLHSSDCGLCSPRAHVGCSGGWLAQLGDCPSAGTPPLSARRCRNHLPGACLQNEDGAPGHPSPSRVWLKCQPQRTGHRRACLGTRAKCWCGMRAGARLVKCLLGMV